MVDFEHANAEFLPASFKRAHIFKRVYLGAYYPPFREKIIEMKRRCYERGCEYWSEFGYRSFALQADLRKKYLAGMGGKAAPAGYSAHQFGLADDSTRDRSLTPGLQPTWEQKAYDVLGEEAARIGLAWGARYADRPHVQWPGFENGTQLAPLRKIFLDHPGATEDECLRACWAYLDAGGI